jgi:hypothetical protein
MGEEIVQQLVVGSLWCAAPGRQFVNVPKKSFELRRGHILRSPNVRHSFL